MAIDQTSNLDMAYFRAPETRTLVTNTLGNGVVGISHVRARNALGVIDDHVVEDAVMVAYQHRQLECDLFLDNRHVPVPGQGVNNITLYDYRRHWNCEIKTGFEATNFYLPRDVLDAVSDASGTSGDLVVAPGATVDDPVIRGLVSTLATTFANPAHACTLFLDHIGWALAAHCAANYLEDGTAAVAANGCLAPWQERVAKEMIDAGLSSEIRLADLAAACGLSVNHFARAFRKSTDVPPHRWMMKRRIERAQNLLLSTRLPVAEIALDCGFHDQSHLTHVFTRLVGLSPAAWRRNRTH
jgi:AraC family transcriptional regulator